MGSATSNDDNVRRFDRGLNADGSSTDLIESTSCLVFPVRINFADSSVISQVETDGHTHTSNETGNPVTFQLNIIFANE